LSPPVLRLIEAPDATSGTVGGMSSLTIWTVGRPPFFSGRSKVVVRWSKYEPERSVKRPMRIVKNATEPTAAQLVLSAWIHLAG
jgi:hypothetical protein